MQINISVAQRLKCLCLAQAVIKGPFAIDKEYPNWNDEGDYDPLFKTVPQVSHVSVWNFYPDPDANNMDEAQFVIERHKMSRTQLRSLKTSSILPFQVIDEVISLGENYTKKYWEDDLRTMHQNMALIDLRFLNIGVLSTRVCWKTTTLISQKN